MATTAEDKTPETMDAELEQYRSLMEVPSTFEEGFSLKAFIGTLFIGILMMPGAIYMGLLAGQAIGPAAQWVTVILFIEVARRAQQALKKAEVFIIFSMAGMLIGSPFVGLLWNQYYARSNAARSNGIQVPWWVAPRIGSTSYTVRSFFNADWYPIIGLMFLTLCLGNLANVILGYGLFRLTSDIEKLPFPMAPVGAQGILALCEDPGDKSSGAGEGAWRWRIFSIGGALGLGFGAIYLLIPVLTGALTGTPVQLLDIPFTDTMAKSQAFLPAVATGMCWDLGNVIMGMVMPFFSVLGAFIGTVLTFILNPILYSKHVLHQWLPGQTTIPTQFSNFMDFYLSFGVGLTLAVAAIGIYFALKGLASRKRIATAAGEQETVSSIPPGRGDIKPFWIFATYFLITIAYIIVCMALIGWSRNTYGVFAILLFFGFLYTPLISYVTARMNGMVGQVVEIPYIREASFILSGYRGVNIWFLPVPQANYGYMTTMYRQSELTGTKFISVWKSQIILTPIIIVFSLLFTSLIWHMAEVPSSVYPFANKMWDLQAANSSVMYTATMGGFSPFQQAFKPIVLGIGFICGLGLNSICGLVGAPVFLFYGLVGGLNQGMIHMVFPQFVGALVGRYYFQKRIGKDWLKYVFVLFAGYMCGSGLITILGVGITFMSKAVVQLPY
jgi:hypothetical protein